MDSETNRPTRDSSPSDGKPQLDAEFFRLWAAQLTVVINAQAQLGSMNSYLLALFLDLSEGKPLSTRSLELLSELQECLTFLQDAISRR